MTSPRRTQAERRAETRAAVLESACRLFGRKGFADTSLDEIASEAGVTIRPIYHYFGSKLELFGAVNEVMEERIVASLQESEGDDLEAWRRYLTLCEDPEFRRIVLVDGPNVLGRERWATSPVTRTVAARLGDSESNTRKLPELAVRMLIGALAEAALAIAESSDPTRTSREAERLVAALVSALALPSKENPS
jgi:AcrR family transcriptional regulator